MTREQDNEDDEDEGDKQVGSTHITYSLASRTKAIMASLEPDAAIASAGSTYPISVAAQVPEWIKAQQRSTKANAKCTHMQMGWTWRTYVCIFSSKESLT